MEKRHTPGPWYVDNSRYEPSIESEHDTIINIVGHDDTESMTKEANAKLIAAAPDLLHELERLIEKFYRGEIGYRDIEQAEAAIAKALE